MAMEKAKQGPGPTPPPPLPSNSQTYSLEPLEIELERLKSYIKALNLSNGDLERSIGEVEEYLKDLDETLEKEELEVDPENIEEWRLRFDCQIGLNQQLQEERDWLESEVAEARKCFVQGSYPEPISDDMNDLSETELLRLVQHLERMRYDYCNVVKSREWNLESNAKEFHHFDEMRLVHKAELKEANETFEGMEIARALNPSLVMSALCPLGYKDKGEKEKESGAKAKNKKRKEKRKNAAKKEESPPESEQEDTATNGDGKNEQDSKTEQGTSDDSPGPDKEEKVEEPLGGEGGDQPPLVDKEEEEK